MLIIRPKRHSYSPLPTHHSRSPAISTRDIVLAAAFVIGLIAWFGLTLGIGYLAPGKHPAPGSPDFAAYAQPHVDDCVKKRQASAAATSGAQATDTAQLQADCLALFIKTRPK